MKKLVVLFLFLIYIFVNITFVNYCLDDYFKFEIKYGMDISFYDYFQAIILNLILCNLFIVLSVVIIAILFNLFKESFKTKQIIKKQLIYE